MKPEIRRAIAVSLYDTFHTARLSEHPDDELLYGQHAESFRHWLRIHGYRVVKSRTSAPSSKG